MKPRTRTNHLRRIRKTMDTWCDVNPERTPWLITLDEDDEITVLAPTGCAADLEEQGYKILAADAELVTATELHRRSIHFHGHAIRHKAADGNDTWTRIDAVHLSAHQGIDIRLQDGSALQACFPEDATYWVTVDRI